MDDILKKFYEKGYKSPNKLFYKIKEKGYDIRKTDAKKYVFNGWRWRYLVRFYFEIR